MARKSDEKEILKRGKETLFWKIICEAINKRIETLQELEESENFEELPADQYKLKSQLVKAERKHLKIMKDYPDILMGRFGTPKNTDIELDPYDK